MRVGFPYGGDTWSGPESDKALADTIRKAGNVILLADATFVGDTTEEQSLPDDGYRINAAGDPRATSGISPGGAACRARRRRSGTISSAWIRMDQSVTSCRSSEPAIARCLRSACPRRYERRASSRRLFESRAIRSSRGAADAARNAQGEDRGRRHGNSLGADSFPRAGVSARPEAASISALFVFRSAVFRRAAPRRPETRHRSRGLQATRSCSSA